MKFLKQADFTHETDLKERLRQQLFGAKVIPFQGREVLGDEDAALVSAAGSTDYAAIARDAAKQAKLQRKE